jgi:hypothetical protein
MEAVQERLGSVQEGQKHVRGGRLVHPRLQGQSAPPVNPAEEEFLAGGGGGRGRSGELIEHARVVHGKEEAGIAGGGVGRGGGGGREGGRERGEGLPDGACRWIDMLISGFEGLFPPFTSSRHLQTAFRFHLHDRRDRQGGFAHFLQTSLPPRAFTRRPGLQRRVLPIHGRGQGGRGPVMLRSREGRRGATLKRAGRQGKEGPPLPNPLLPPALPSSLPSHHSIFSPTPADLKALDGTRRRQGR